MFHVHSKIWHMIMAGWWQLKYIFFLNPYLGKWSNSTNIFQVGWNHQPYGFLHGIVSIWAKFADALHGTFFGSSHVPKNYQNWGNHYHQPTCRYHFLYVFWHWKLRTVCCPGCGAQMDQEYIHQPTNQTSGMVPYILSYMVMVLSVNWLTPASSPARQLDLDGDLLTTLSAVVPLPDTNGVIT